MIRDIAKNYPICAWFYNFHVIGENIVNSSSNLRIVHINIRSLRNKLDKIKLLWQLCRFDILSIAESHLNQNISNQQLNFEK
jgi:hypothetical protein